MEAYDSLQIEQNVLSHMDKNKERIRLMKLYEKRGRRLLDRLKEAEKNVIGYSRPYESTSVVVQNESKMKSYRTGHRMYYELDNYLDIAKRKEKEEQTVRDTIRDEMKKEQRLVQIEKKYAEEYKALLYYYEND